MSTDDEYPDFAAFLAARLNDDEAMANACHGAPWSVDMRGMIHVKAKPGDPQRWQELGLVAEFENLEYADHVVRWDPARVLAAVKAKREILRRYDLRRRDELDGKPWASAASIAAFENVILLLTTVYADHPDYKQEWAGSFKPAS